MDQEFQSQQNLCVIIRRIAKNQYIPSMQPIHATSDMKWGAFADFKENEIGKLKQGYQADLVILDRDVSRVPAKDLLKTRVLRTYVRGKQVFGTADFKPANP
jgi:predicted amidohydrolase YtcJ